MRLSDHSVSTQSKLATAPRAASGSNTKLAQLLPGMTGLISGIQEDVAESLPGREAPGSVDRPRRCGLQTGNAQRAIDFLMEGTDAHRSAGQRDLSRESAAQGTPQEYRFPTLGKDVPLPFGRGLDRIRRQHCPRAVGQLVFGLGTARFESWRSDPQHQDNLGTRFDARRASRIGAEPSR